METKETINTIVRQATLICNPNTNDITIDIYSTVNSSIDSQLVDILSKRISGNLPDGIITIGIIN